MKKTIKYTDGEIGNIKIIDDFLPSREELAFKGENTKITISLIKETVDFFKDEAKKRSTVFGLLKGRMVDPVKWQRTLREENDREIYNGK